MKVKDKGKLTEAVLREVSLADADIQGNPDHHIVEVTLIRSGTSRNGNHYDAAVLQESTHLFEGARAFADHPVPDGRPERSIRDLVGYYRDPYLDDNGRLRAQLHLIPGHDWLWGLIQESQRNPELFGLSIDALGEAEKFGRSMNVRSIRKVDSVDIVTKPAAGGSFDRILQSDRSKESRMTKKGNQDNGQGDPGDENDKGQGNAEGKQAGTGTKLQEGGKTPPENGSNRNGTNGDSGNTGNGNGNGNGNGAGTPGLAELVEQLTADRDSMRKELARVGNVLNPNAGSTNEDPNGIAHLAEELRRDRDLTRAEAALTTKLTESELPKPVADKLRRRYGGKTFDVVELEEAIKDEKDTLAILTSSGQVEGLGFEKVNVSGGMNEYEQIQAAMDSLFDIYESEEAKSIPKFQGIREAFKICTGVDVGSIGGVDKPLKETVRRQMADKARNGQLRESEVILREADVQTSTFSFLLGTSMNKRLLADYQAWPSEWQKFTTIVGIKDFKQQDRVRLGAFGSLSTVAEDAAYTTLSLTDTRAIYTASKRGNLVQVTRETIVNDDLYAIKQIPQKLAVAAAFTLAEFVYNLLSPAFGNIYDAHSLFDSINHLNTGILAASLGTKNSGAGLTSAALQTAVIAMRKQQNLANKPIGLKPRYLLVVPELEFTAMTILKSAGLPGGNNNDINPMMGYAEPIVVPQFGNLAAGPAADVTMWMAVADPKVIDTVEVGFVGGQANPVLLIQDMPLYGLNFTQDTISYKVRHEYGGAVVDYRGFYLGNN